MQVILKSGGPVMNLICVESKSIEGPQVWVCQWSDSEGNRLTGRFSPDELFKLAPAAGGT